MGRDKGFVSSDSYSYYDSQSQSSQSRKQLESRTAPRDAQQHAQQHALQGAQDAEGARMILPHVDPLVNVPDEPEEEDFGND